MPGVMSWEEMNWLLPDVTVQSLADEAGGAEWSQTDISE